MLDSSMVKQLTKSECGNFSRKVTPFLQQVHVKGKKREARPEIKRDLRDAATKLCVWTVFGPLFEQTNHKE